MKKTNCAVAAVMLFALLLLPVAAHADQVQTQRTNPVTTVAMVLADPITYPFHLMQDIIENMNRKLQQKIEADFNCFLERQMQRIQNHR